MKAEDSFSLIVSGRVVIVRRREGTDTVFDATFQDPLPAGPEGFTIAARIPPVGEAEMDAVSEVVRDTAETLIRGYGSDNLGAGD